ncbi:DNA cytosine methyltransferase [Herbaspirillum rubrisubalbicans]|uniref:DNA cytosine methyltransferase n=1 Tax=Herbaspirillum rubrisubalbicans TaxID=80842 RepID=UPI001C658007|nr:DNA cytosine methyltransferase [Herbaspirillum rubrisubalbicans]
MMRPQSNYLVDIPANPEIWSFFSGAMGLDLGLELAGLHTTLAVENDKNCCNTIRKNRPNLTVIERSVSELSAEDLRTARGGYDGEVFLMVGGPPCQSFSSGGNRSGLTDPRGNLIYEYMRLINEVRPRYFVFENVANIVTAALKHRPISRRPGKKWNLSSYKTSNEQSEDGASPLEEEEMGGSAIRQILKDYLSIGYHIHFAVVDAADYGAPQRRLRFVMLGARNGFNPPNIPSPEYGHSPLKPIRTVRDAISDLEKTPGAHSIYTNDVAKYFSLVPEGKNWRSLPIDLQKEAMGSSFDAGGGKTGFYRRLAWNLPAPTITGAANRKASALCHPSQTRPLSTKECARIQGFPDDWEITGSMAAQYKQIGNAVPVHLGEAIGRAILAAARSTSNVSASMLPPCANSQLTLAQDRLKASARNKVANTNKTLSLFEEA